MVWPENHRNPAGHVVFLDGHTEYMKYRSEFPMTKTSMQALVELDQKWGRSNAHDMKIFNTSAEWTDVGLFEVGRPDFTEEFDKIEDADFWVWRVRERARIRDDDRKTRSIRSIHGMDKAAIG